ADHPGVEQVEREIQGVLSLGHRADGWTPPIVRTVATDGTGIDKLIAAVEEARAIGKKRQPMVGPLRIDHLGIAVKSIDAALEFYAGQLGMDVPSREIVEQEKVKVAMLP